MKSTFLAATALLLALTLSACGGGGSSTTTALTPTTQAPVASTGSDTSTELASSVSISGYRSVSIAATTTNGVQTASLLNKMRTAIAGFFIKPAIAQSSSTCQTDAYKLVGVGEDGSLTPLKVTQGTDSCNVGFREMFDLGSYVMLTGEGIYKNDLTCNIVFVQKSTGNLFCVGESLASRYQIATNSSGSSPSAGSSTSNAEKVQTILATDGATSYALVNAQSTTFDSNNQISGIKTKVLRFDLTDLTNGPKAAVLLEGFQSSWSSYNTASEFEYYSLDNYRLAKNGDVLTVSNKSVWIPGATSSNRRNLKYFYNFSSDGADFETATLKDSDALVLINAALSAQTANNTGYSVAGGSSSASATTYTYLQVACMFDAPNNDGGILMTTPSSSWISGYNSSTGQNTSQWTQSSSIFRVGRPNSSSAGKPVIEYVKPSLLCADSNSYSMYGGNVNTPQKVGNTWFTLQTTSTYSYGYNSSTNIWESSYGSKTSVIGNSLDATTNNVNNDLVYVIPTSSASANNYGYYWGGGMNNTKLRSSKDYLYLIKQDFSNYTPGSSSGMVVSRFKPQDQRNGYTIENISNVIEAASNLTITSFTTTQKDNVADLVARDLSSDELDKVYGTISETGAYSQKPITTTRYSTVAIVKL